MLFIGLPSATEAWSEILADTSDLSVASPPGGTKGRVAAWHGHQGQPLRSDRKRLLAHTHNLQPRFSERLLFTHSSRNPIPFGRLLSNLPFLVCVRTEVVLL